MQVYVFSYNRGQYLNNCINSIFKCIPNANVTIIDDNSSEDSTIKILNKWNKMCNIIVPSSVHKSYKVGGLYNNMNYAMNHALNDKIKYVLFIQDDMQVVREYTSHDNKIIDTYFNKNSKAVQYYSCFFKLNAKKATENRKLDDSKIVYYKDINLQYSGFAAIGIFHVERFKSFFGEFKNRERLMDNIAREKGIQKGDSVYPFMMYLPFPRSYRENNRPLAHIISEKISGAGFYPIDYMDEKTLNKLFDRDPSIIPFAEDYLTVNGIKKKPWSFAGGITALYEQGGWRRILGRILNRL